jgi:hypothetical protein
LNLAHYLQSLGWQVVEKAFYRVCDIAVRKTRLSNASHFQWVATIENDTTSLYRTQAAGRTRTMFFNSLLNLNTL